MKERSLISEDSSLSSYIASSKQSPEDHKIEGWYKQSLIDRLEEKLSGFATGDVSLGNYVLGNGFANDYLSYLKDGGDLDIEGYRKYIWNNNHQILNHDRLSE